MRLSSVTRRKKMRFQGAFNFISGANPGSVASIVLSVPIIVKAVIFMR